MRASETSTKWTYAPLTKHIAIDHGYAFESAYFSNTGQYALATPGNFYEHGGFRSTGEKQRYYTGPFPSSYQLQPHDLIVAMTEQADGLLGSAAFVPEDKVYLHNQRIGRIRINSNRVSLDYLFWVFNSKAYRKAVNETAAGTKVRHTSPSKLMSIEVPIPPIDEQNLIAGCLADANHLSISLGRLIAKKQAIKHGIMQQLLTGKTRLPGFTEPWAEVRLGDIATMGSGGTPNSGNARYYGGRIPWVSISDMTTSGKHVKATEKTLSQRGLDASAAKLYGDGVVLYAMYASIGECAIAVGRVSSSQAILGINPGPRISRDYLYYYLSSIKSSVREMGQQGTQANLNAGMVRGFSLSIPSIDEQHAIAQAIGDVDDELASLESRMHKAIALKQGIMQELLTGRTRLQPAEASA